MMIRDEAQLFRCWGHMAGVGTLLFICAMCALCWDAGDAFAAPYAQHGRAVPDWRTWLARPVISVGLCDEDREPCPGYRRPAVDRPVHAGRWDPAPERYVEERPAIPPPADCAPDPYVAQGYTIAPVVAPPAVDYYGEPCWIKCWYNRLREGYCGRGCDYYRFRMTRFPEGPLYQGAVRVTCR
jgi:hypothetical protein